MNAALQAPIPISVVIPVRNSVPQLLECLQALLANQLEAVEILVIDDASTDDIGEVIASIAPADEVPIRCLRLPRQSGPAAARNKGARLARNSYVLFLDSDIILPRESIGWIRETLLSNEDRPEVIGVMGVYNETIPATDFCSNFKNIYICFLHKTTPTLSPYLHTPILCMRREILETAGGFDTSLATAEDFRLGLKLGSQGYRFIIDRRIQGTHLKRLTPCGLLKEDSRRLRDLMSIQRDKEQQRQTYRAHRWSRLLSVTLPAPTLAITAATFLFPVLAWVAALCWLSFYVCNFGFVTYAIDRKGLFFGIQSAAFLFLEMLWAQATLAYWLIRK